MGINSEAFIWWKMSGLDVDALLGAVYQTDEQKAATLKVGVLV